MYSPRNGTIAGPGARHPTSAATRSDCSPAQTTSRSTVAGRRSVATSIRPPAALDAGHRGRQPDPTAGRVDLVGERRGDRRVVGDRGLRRVQRRDPGGVRLDVGDARRPRRGAAPGRRWRGRSAPARRTAHSLGVDGDHELAALVVAAARARRSTPDQQRGPRRAQLGLEAARLVVDAGVHDAGVVAGLVGGDPVLLLEHHDPAPGPPADELAADGQADDAAADDADALFPHGRAAGASRGRRQATPAFIPQWADARPPRPRRPGPARGPGRARRRAGGALLEVAGSGRAVGQHHRLAGRARAPTSPASTALTVAQRARALRRWPTGRITVAASEHRSQHRNRVAARERLADLLREALAPPPPPRRPTPTLTRGQGAAAQGEEGARLDQGPPRPGAGPGIDAPSEADAAVVAGGGTAYDVALRVGGLGELGLVVDHPLLQRRVARGEDADGQQPGVAGVADRDRRDRDAGRHLHDRQQRVHAVEVLQRHRHADDRQRRDRGEHARQVGRSPGAGDDAPASPRPAASLAVGEHLVGHPVRGDDVGLEADAELGEGLGGGLHDRPVGVRAHDDADHALRSSLDLLTRSRCRGRRGTTRRRAARARGSRRGRRRRR